MSAIIAVPTLANVTANHTTDTSHTASVKLYDRRGNWIADGYLTISNPRNGRIGIYMSTFCHVAVDEIEMDIAVEQNVNGDWEQVDYLTFNFYPEGDKPLLDASVDFQLGGHPANQTYRLNGEHFVFVGNSSESLGGVTGGLLITDH